MIPKRYELTDEQWDRIAPLLKRRSFGRPLKIDDRTALNSVLWLLKSGATWRDLPERYGSWKTIYSRFRLWADQGIFEKVFLELRTDDPDLENVTLDSTSVKVHQKGTGSKKRTMRRKSTSYWGKSWW